MLFTKKEAADILKVCPATVRRMMKRGDLQGFRVGKITRIVRGSFRFSPTWRSFLYARLIEVVEDDLDVAGFGSRPGGHVEHAIVEPELHALRFICGDEKVRARDERAAKAIDMLHVGLPDRVAVGEIKSDRRGLPRRRRGFHDRGDDYVGPIDREVRHAGNP